MTTRKTHIYRLFSLLFFVSVLITACGDQSSKPEQSKGTASTAVTGLSHIATTLYVDSEGTCNGLPSCYTSIQAAINDASSGDTVQVLAGTYTENITLKTGVVVQGSGAAVTAIRGTGTGSVVTAAYVDATAKIDGFTITGGYCTRGGGIYTYQSSPMISNVTITGNYAIDGGGIANIFSSPLISNTTITGNSADRFGGGIANTSSSPVITNAAITGNFASDSGGGIANLSSSSPVITNTTISGNSSDRYGGGIANLSSSSPVITNTTITGNSSSVYGGGIANLSSSLLIQDSIITSNTGGGISNSTGSITSDYNDVFGNTSHDYAGVTAGTHDISANPKFVDGVSGDYRLQSDSPCIDAGNSAAVPEGITKDLYGNPRIADGNGDGTAVADMGAAEYPAVLTISVMTPTSAGAVQDVFSLQATATGAQSVEFFVREPGGTNGISIGYDNLAANFDSATGTWKHSLTTTALPDGFYIVFATARNSVGAEVTSDAISFTIRNWATIRLLPSTSVTNAGRTILVKFAIRVASYVDPLQPFVHNEELEIRIYRDAILRQTSHYGLSTADYRINDPGQFYITNIKTDRKPATYAVKIMRKEFVIGEFTFITVR